jgi:flavorubredoxin
MGKIIPVADKVFLVGVNDRHTRLFEALWPLPNGIAYNSYLIDDEKVVLIDAVKEIFTSNLLRMLEAKLGPGRQVDYLVINHMEPDHSGALRLLSRVFPDMKIVGNRKTIEFLAELHGITENLLTVQDGGVLELGKRRLNFITTPMVHWPETMMTYEAEDKILFSGDAFGGFGTLEQAVFDDETHDRHFFEGETLRYFSNIIGKFSSMVQKALQKIKPLPVNIIAPAHGLIWRREPARIIDLYDRWSRHEPCAGVTIAYGSMYSNTEKEMEFLARTLVQEGIDDIRVHNVSHSHISYMIRDIWDTGAVILGTPTYDVGIFPYLRFLLQMLEDKKLKSRLLGIFGSYGWSGGGVKGIAEFAKKVDWEIVEPIVEARFFPNTDDLNQCEKLARNLAQRLGMS